MGIPAIPVHFDDRSRRGAPQFEVCSSHPL
jgi:hypothetical protein